MRTTRSFFLSIPLLFLFTHCSKHFHSSTFKKDGFISLFNGKDLTGWKIPDGDKGHWKVVNGVIDYDALSEAPGDKNLYTEKHFRNYTLHVEWRFKEYSGLYPMPTILPNGEYARDSAGKVVTFMMPNSDAGIIMRGKDQVQMWCWAIGSGEIWSTRLNRDLSPAERAKAVPKFHADNPVGQWNAFDITMKGNRVMVYLNNILVIEDALMPGLPEKGPIGLQHHGGMNKRTGKLEGSSSLTQFRNIWIKELH